MPNHSSNSTSSDFWKHVIKEFTVSTIFVQYCNHKIQVFIYFKAKWNNTRTEPEYKEEMKEFDFGHQREAAALDQTKVQNKVWSDVDVSRASPLGHRDSSSLWDWKENL